MAVPGLAVLAAFSLPTLKRNASAAIDWFSVFFFSLCVLTVWVIYASMHFGLPRQPLNNILRLVPGFIPQFSGIALACALFGTASWCALVRWRTARHRHPIWKSLVLPAGGVAVVWLLTMTLLLPALDYGRSTRPLVAELGRSVPYGGCLLAVDVPRTHIAGLEVFGGYKVDSLAAAVDSSCPDLLRMSRSALPPPLAGWDVVASIHRPVDRKEYFTLYRKSTDLTRLLPAEPLE
jgi:hypothetical protein